MPQEKDFSQYEDSSIIVKSTLDARVESVRIKQFDELLANTLLLSLNTDEYKAEVALAMANIELINAGKEPSGAPLSLTIKNAVAQKESEFSKAKTKEENASQEYKYWTNELAKILLQLRKPSTNESDRAQLTIQRDNATLMQSSAQEQLENARKLSLEAEKKVYEFKKAQEKVLNAYEDIFLWQQKINEAEAFIEMSDFYSAEKIIILDVYVKENEEISIGQNLYKYAVLPQ